MKLSHKFLAGAILAVLPLSGALACSTAAWSSVVGAPIAGDPAPGDGDVTSRWSGRCGLKSAAGGNSYVVSNHPADTTFRARGYSLTTPTANATVFEAYSDEAGTTAVITVQYQPGAGQFVVTSPGSNPVNVPGIEANRWYGFEVLRVVGSPIQVSVQGGGGGGFDAGQNRNEQNIDKVIFSQTGTGNATGGAVEAARFGVVGATTGQGIVDEYDSSRSAATPIGFLLRGDCNGSLTRDVGDAVAVAREAVTPLSFTGQCDANGNGGIEAGDIVSAARIAVGL